MKAVVDRTWQLYDYKFFVPVPEEFKNIWEADAFPGIEVSTRLPQDLPSEYLNAHYGLLLREESVINKVSSPTKLTEYLAHGLIPVLNSANVGDFVEEGMQYLKLDDLLNGRVPSEDKRYEMALKNLEVLKKFQALWEKNRLVLLAIQEQFSIQLRKDPE